VTGTAPSELNVLVLIDSLTAGGAELLLTDFAVGAPGAGVRASVAYLGERDGSPAGARLREHGIEPVCLDLAGLLHPPSFMRVRRHLREVRPDLVHTHLAYADAVGGLAARSLGIPTVSTVHVMEWRADDLRDRVRNRLIATVRRRCAAAVVAVSEASRQAVLNAGWERPERVVTIWNGVVATPLPGSGAAVREALGIAPGEPVVAQVAVLREGKGHEAAAAAIERLRPRFPGLRLLVVGDGPAREQVARAMEPLGDSVRLLGHRDDVMAVLDAADVVVHPSTIDAFPTALLLADQALRALWGSAGRERFEREFTAESWAARTRRLYDRVLLGRSGASQ
jgi:glycosyltransferase involved in cell wall biosynthesis